MSKEDDCYTAYEGGYITINGNYQTQKTSFVSKHDYAWLRRLALNTDNDVPISIKTDIHGERIAIGQYVGLLPLPSGKIIEILPKTSDQADSKSHARKALLRMSARAGSLPLKSLESAAQSGSDRPFHHSLLDAFFTEVESLLRQGLASSYNSVEDRRPVLKGKLLTKKQILSKEPIPLSFHTRAHEYFENRPENRLLRSALDLLAPLSKRYDLVRFKRISEFFSAIPNSQDFSTDFHAWSQDRLSMKYKRLESWCRLILLNSGTPTNGVHELPALLFPMERLFESYVGSCIRDCLPRGFTLVSQSRKWSLVTRDNTSYNVLKPDFSIRKNNKDFCIIDAKWKMIEISGSKDLEDVSPADLYQLYAYGRHYLGGSGALALAYPKTKSFYECREPLHYVADRDLSLQLLPIDLEMAPEMLANFIRSVLQKA